MEIIFGPEEAHEAPEMDQKSPEASTRVEGTPPSSWLPPGPPDMFPMPTPLIYPQTFRTERRSGVPPPQGEGCVVDIRHVQGGVMTELITLKTHMMKNCIT